MTIQEHKAAAKQVAARLIELRRKGTWADRYGIRFVAGATARMR